MHRRHDTPGLVSVVLVTFNSAADIEACLAALATDSPGIPLEVIAVDNASTDSTPALLAGARRPEARLVLSNAANRGFAAAANQGAKRAAGECVLFLNPDARLAGGSLAALASALGSNPRAAAAGPQLLSPDGSLQVSARPRPGLVAALMEGMLLDSLFPRSRWLCTEPADGAPMPCECLSGACLLFRRSVFEAIGGFDERFFMYAEDVDLCVRARQAGHELLMVPQARVVHRCGGSAFQARGDFVLQINRAKLHYARKHLGAWRRALFALLQIAGLVFHVLVHGIQGLARWKPDRLQEAGHEAAALRALLKEVGSSRRR